jgi:hypothetical protein
MKASLALIALAACTSAPSAVRNTATPSPIVKGTATSLVEAMQMQHLALVQLPVSGRNMNTSILGAPIAKGRSITVGELGGYNASHATFARRDSDGAIVVIVPKPNRIVDGHEDAGCLRFAGGRAWFEQVTYELPRGEKFGGTVEVAYDDHVTIKDYADTELDGTPCPPPAID